MGVLHPRSGTHWPVAFLSETSSGNAAPGRAAPCGRLPEDQPAPEKRAKGKQSASVTCKAATEKSLRAPSTRDTGEAPERHAPSARGPRGCRVRNGRRRKHDLWKAPFSFFLSKRMENTWPFYTPGNSNILKKRLFLVIFFFLVIF